MTRNCLDGGHHGSEVDIVTWDTFDPDEKLANWGGHVWLKKVMIWRTSLRSSATFMILMLKTWDLSPSRNEMNCALPTFYKYWPQGFRWTFCRLLGDYEWGCDHHFKRCGHENYRCEASWLISSCWWECYICYKLLRGSVEERNWSPHAKRLVLGEGREEVRMTN